MEEYFSVFKAKNRDRISSSNRPSSDFAAMLLEVFFIPKTDLQNL
jgi:hypothetical protein